MNVFQRPDKIGKRKLMGSRYAWRKDNSYIKMLIKGEPVGKIPLR